MLTTSFSVSADANIEFIHIYPVVTYILLVFCSITINNFNLINQYNIEITVDFLLYLLLESRSWFNF